MLVDSTGVLGACIAGIDHVALAVTDSEGAIGWYTQKVEFMLAERRYSRGERM
jgi:methylmalonyl-CoA/ethylmalonyl-CoA epimerase